MNSGVSKCLPMRGTDVLLTLFLKLLEILVMKNGKGIVVPKLEIFPNSLQPKLLLFLFFLYSLYQWIVLPSIVHPFAPVKNLGVT